MTAYRRQFLIGACLVAIATAAAPVLLWNRTQLPVPDENGIYHVLAGGDIQATLDAAGENQQHKHVQVHAGVYRPLRHGQAFIWFNAKHDGIALEAVGDVTLTAANPELAAKSDPSYPAVVNHVVYFGDGITRQTVLRGFKITGANGYLTKDERPLIETSAEARQHREMFYYTDGGGIKIFGRSYPTIDGVEVFDNFTSPCGAGVSIEHRGHMDHSVLLANCIFRNNRCTVTGAAVDVLNESSAEIDNCLFVGNLSNTHMDERAQEVGKWKPDHGSGALTVFPESRVVVRNCTFVGNRSGIDDSSTAGNRYENSIFWQNDAPGGWAPGVRYELDVADGSSVRNCHLNGDLIDLTGTVSREVNVFGCKDPSFDEMFVPRAEGFDGVGYRPPPR